MVSKNVIAEWQDGHAMEEGQYSFPFEFDLPEWLPSSVTTADPDGNIFMQVKYMLIAQIEGLEYVYVE